jgi:hypothetical protein
MINIGESSNLRYNIKAHFELLFLNNGMFGHALVGQYDYAGREASILKKNGRYFESVANSWVYEEDVVTPSGYMSPISVSGVWINSVFHASNSDPYKPVPDYDNGRFLFKGLVPTATDTVEANFTFKDVAVDFTDSETYNVIESQYLHNPDYWSQNVFPSGVERLLPVVVIDLQTKGHEPWQIGGGKINGDRVDFWVMAARDWERDAIMDVIFREGRAVISAADFDQAPEVLTFYGEKAPTYQSFTDLGTNYPWTRLYIDKMAIRGRDLVGKIYRGKVEGIFTVYQNP